MIKTAKDHGENVNVIRPRSWIIEVSNDNLNWITIDEQKDCQTLNGSEKIAAFNIKKQISDKFRYIKLRQTGLNWYQGYTPTNNLVICSIEFYGYLS